MRSLEMGTVGIEPAPIEDSYCSLAGILSNGRHRTVLLKTSVTLTLGIMGGAILPLSWGFQQTGILWGFIIMVAVSFTNDYTCGLLLRQAEVFGAHDYESLSLSIGGQFYKYFTEFAIIILLLGSIVGAILQCGEAGSIGLEDLSSQVPHWLIDRSGSLLMAFVTIFIAYPLCHYSKLQELDKAAFVGITLVIWLLVVVLLESIRKGLPAISSGQLAVAGIPKIKHISQATSIFGFAFYIQPIMMPYLLEVPSGKVGISILKWSTRIVVLGISFVIYAIIGLFGAARYGAQTSDNILENKWMGGGIGQGILNLSIYLYLALSVPMIEFPIRHTVSCWFPETKKSLLRRLSVSAVIMLLSLLLALIFPNNSGNVLVVTGAVGVCIVSYLVPITNHFCLLFKRVKVQGNAQVQPNSFRTSNLARGGDDQMLEDGTEMNLNNVFPIVSYRLKRKDGVLNMINEIFWEYFVPILVIIIGLFYSIMALSTL